MGTLEDTKSSHVKKKVLRSLLLGVLVGLLVSVGFSVLRRSAPQGRSKVSSQLELGDQIVKVPFQLVKGMPVVEVMVNGQGPYRFVLDTGAEMTCISERLEEEVGFGEPKGEVTKISASTDKSTGPHKVFRIELLQAGTAGFRNFPAVMLDDTAILKIADGRCDGILGRELFADCLLSIDFSQAEITMQRGELPEPNGKDILTIEDDMGISAYACEIQVNLKIDTGSSAGITLSDRLVGREVRITERKECGCEVKTLVGDLRVWAARLDGDVDVGKYSIKTPWVHAAPINVDGFIGTGMLKRFAITIDQKNKRVRLRYASQSQDIGSE